MSIRILPFRQYSDTDVVNLYALDNNSVLDATTDVGSGDAGVFVSVTDGNWNNDPVTYQTNTYLGDTSFPFLGTASMYPEVNLKINAASSGDLPLGITLFQTAKNDENGEKLLYNPTKQTELQAMLPGQAVPVATKGIFTLCDSGFDGDAVDYPIGSPVRISDSNPGKITGVSPVAPAAGHHHNHNQSGLFGMVLGTGTRTNQGPTSDQFLGDYIVIKL
tara:strand:+ start:1926 stop:2582 length:657 start_codon:yes stop_codon:yes gene_type:complete